MAGAAVGEPQCAPAHQREPGTARESAPLVGKEGIPRGTHRKGSPSAVFRPFLAAERDGLRGLSA